MDMPHQLKNGFARIAAARQTMIEVRSARSETLQRFKNLAKAKLADFITNTDPVTGARFADVSAGGDKARGESAMILSFFEGTRFRLTVDTCAQFHAETEPAELLADVGRVIDIVVPMDLSRAEMTYEPASGPSGSKRTLDLVDLIVRMVDNAARTVEEQLGDAAPSAAPPARPAAAARPAFSFSIT
jgi:hypothetical protein